MLAAVTNGKKFAWGDWLLGIMRSFISGGAGAITSGGVVGLKDPQDWGIHSGKLFELMGIVFLATGIIHMMIFLQTHPVPDVEQLQQSLQQAENATANAAAAIHTAQAVAPPADK